MTSQCQEFSPCIQQVIKLFNTGNTVAGKFKLMFTPANAILDSDGKTVIDAYLKPIDDVARKSMIQTETSEEFLHLQMLSDTVPESILGYSFVVSVHGADSFIYEMDLQDTDESRVLYETLNKAA